MTINLESREDYTGVMHLQANKDTIVTFAGRSYLENLPYLTDAASRFVARNFCWPLEVAQFCMTKAMKIARLTGGRELDEGIMSMIVEDPKKAREIPSVMLFRKENTEPGAYGGISVQRMFFIQTEDSGEVPVLYHVLRAMERDYRRKGRGKLSVQLALLVHGGARKYMHRSVNPIAVYANLRSPILVQEDRHPIDSPFDTNPLNWEIARKVFDIVKINGTELEPNGVSRHDYPVPNRGFMLREIEGTPIMEVQRQMTVLSREEGGWDMFLNRLEGSEDPEGTDSGHYLYNVR